MHDLISVAPEILDAPDDSVSAALSIPDDVRDDLAGIATEVRQQRVACVESAIEIGRLLEDARGRLSKRGNGIFKKWVEAECGLAETTAKRFMRAFRVFGERATVARTFELNAIHVLSTPSCPNEAREAAEKLADAGEIVTARVAKELVEKYAPEKPEKPLTDLELIDLIRKAIWTIWKRAPKEWQPLVIPKFRGFLAELESTGDLSW